MATGVLMALLHCPAGCDTWWGPASALAECGGRECPHCGVALEERVLVALAAGPMGSGEG